MRRIRGPSARVITKHNFVGEIRRRDLGGGRVLRARRAMKSARSSRRDAMKEGLILRALDSRAVASALIQPVPCLRDSHEGRERERERERERDQFNGERNEQERERFEICLIPDLPSVAINELLIPPSIYWTMISPSRGSPRHDRPPCSRSTPSPLRRRFWTLQTAPQIPSYEEYRTCDDRW
jgi:hypothetical protein